MRIAIIGADGQLGSDLVKTLRQDEVLPLFFPDFDITRPEPTRAVLRQLNPEVVINTAAYHRVDECEDHPEAAFQVNALAVRELALMAKDLGFILVHFSTDYVFDGTTNRPYVEEDVPHPLNVYGVSKLAGEFFVRNIVEKYFLVRTGGLFGEAGSRGKGYNFIDLMISLAGQGKALRVVDDQRVSPTSSAELADRISELIRTAHYGLFHLSGEGECTWFELAREIFSQLGMKPQLEAVDSRTFNAKAKRPPYSVLENKRAKTIGLKDLPPWQKALADYLRKKGYPC